MLAFAIVWNLFISGVGVMLLTYGRRDADLASMIFGTAMFLGGFAPWLPAA